MKFVQMYNIGQESALGFRLTDPDQPAVGPTQFALHPFWNHPSGSFSESADPDGIIIAFYDHILFKELDKAYDLSKQFNFELIMTDTQGISRYTSVELTNSELLDMFLDIVAEYASFENLTNENKQKLYQLTRLSRKNQNIDFDIIALADQAGYTTAMEEALKQQNTGHYNNSALVLATELKRRLFENSDCQLSPNLLIDFYANIKIEPSNKKYSRYQQDQVELWSRLETLSINPADKTECLKKMLLHLSKIPQANISYSGQKSVLDKFRVKDIFLKLCYGDDPNCSLPDFRENLENLEMIFVLTDEIRKLHENNKKLQPRIPNEMVTSISDVQASKKARNVNPTECLSTLYAHLPETKPEEMRPPIRRLDTDPAMNSTWEQKTPKL